VRTVITRRRERDPRALEVWPNLTRVDASTHAVSTAIWLEFPSGAA